jgi:Recombinase
LVRHVAFYWVSRAVTSAGRVSLKHQRELVRAYARISGKLVEEVQASDRTVSRDLEAAAQSARRNDAALVIPNLRPILRRPGLMRCLMRYDIHVVSLHGTDPEQLGRVEFAAALQRWLDSSRKIRLTLQAARAKGIKLGNPNIDAIQRKGTLAAAKNGERMMQNSDLVNEIVTLRKGGRSLRVIASYLNRHRIPTARGGLWHASTVRNILQEAMG